MMQKPDSWIDQLDVVHEMVTAHNKAIKLGL